LALPTSGRALGGHGGSAFAALEEASETLFFPSCGRQAEAMKASEPMWSLGKASRDAEKKVFISNKHPQDMLGKDSPGPVYIPKRQRHLPSWGFGTAAARPAVAAAKYPDTSNDLLGALPDSQVFKYTNRSASVGRSARNAPVNSPEFEGYPAGAISPGPQRYRPDKAPPAHRFSWAPGADNIPPKYSIPKNNKKNLAGEVSQTPSRVGPGCYPPELGETLQPSCGNQAKSTNPSLPQWSFSKTARFPTPHQHGDAGRLWDGMGDGKIAFNRAFSSPPGYSFGTSTRQHAKKVQRVMCGADHGPSYKMEKPRKDHPHLATRKEILKFTDVPAGAH